MNKPISTLQVIEVHYINGHQVTGIEIPTAKYHQENVYESANVPLSIAEPNIPDGHPNEDEIGRIGKIGGEIAKLVFEARRQGAAILMTGGNCCHMTGMLGGLQDAHGPDVRIGLVWFDAHGDFNTSNTTISGMLGGMPVAVAAGLTYPEWRELSHIVSPIPTNRIILVDARNLDPAEETLIRATDTTIASVATGYPGDDLERSLQHLVNNSDLIYFHIDSDILDEAYTPNHKTKEPAGPSIEQVSAAIESVMSTGIVAGYAVVSVPGQGTGAEKTIEAGMTLIKKGLQFWVQYGMA